MNTAVKLSLFYLILLFSAISQSQSSSDRSEKPIIDDSYYSKIKATLFSQPYSQLPYYKVDAKRFGPSKPQQDNVLYQAARRTLESSQDWLIKAPGPKLFNANGICFAGSWNIDQHSSYTGLFTKGTHVNLLARASVVLSGTLKKHKRAFGLSLKLFPPDADRTYNLVTANSLSGKKVTHVLDLLLDNEPELTGLPPISQIGKLLRINKDLLAADKHQGASKERVNYRSVKHLAKYGTSPPIIQAEDNRKEKSVVNAPTWIRFSAKTNERIDKDDFRDELNILHYKEGKIIYTIEVATGQVGKKKKAKWQTLGTIQLDESISSRACDINLHFQHSGPE